MDMCLNVWVSTRYVTQQPRRGRLMKFRNLVVLRRQASVRDGVVGCLVPPPVGHASHNPDEIARKAIPVVVMQRDFVPVGTHPAPQFRFCSLLQDHVNHSTRIVHGTTRPTFSDPTRSVASGNGVVMTGTSSAEYSTILVDRLTR
jgi:hypothetical protein